MAPGILASAAHQVQTFTPFKVAANQRCSYSLLDHTAAPFDYEALAFQAAASQQIQLHPIKCDRQTNNLLVSSTYNIPSHLLDLSRLETPSQLLALALTFMKPIRTDYATAPYTESFNWDEVFQVLKQLVQAEHFDWRQQDFYVVIFRSRLKETADRQRLGELDARSHEEANVSGGLLKYWFGSPSEDRRNLATCLWRSPEDARAGGLGPWHKQARAAAREMYEKIDFTTYRLIIEDNVSDWRLEDSHPRS